MPKKPKHIQDKVDQLIREGHISKEIIAIMKKDNHPVSVSYISGRRTKIKKIHEKKETAKPLISPSISKDSFKILYNLMGLFGEENLDDTIKTISDDYREILKQKYRYDLDNKKTVAQVFNEFEEVYRILDSLDKKESKIKIGKKMRKHRENDELFLYYNLLNLKELLGYEPNFFDFLRECTIRYWRDVKGLTLT